MALGVMATTELPKIPRLELGEEHLWEERGKNSSVSVRAAGGGKGGQPGALRGQAVINRSNYCSGGEQLNEELG